MMEVSKLPKTVKILMSFFCLSLLSPQISFQWQAVDVCGSKGGAFFVWLPFTKNNHYHIIREEHWYIH